MMLSLPESLMHSTATASLTELLQALPAQPAGDVVVDASRLQRFDSSALAVLLELRRAGLKLQRTLSLQGLPPRLADLARLYGIAELLSLQA